jgi:hypothetical protein
MTAGSDPDRGDLPDRVTKSVPRGALGRYTCDGLGGRVEVHLAKATDWGPRAGQGRS